MRGFVRCFVRRLLCGPRGGLASGRLRLAARLHIDIASGRCQCSRSQEEPFEATCDNACWESQSVCLLVEGTTSVIMSCVRCFES